MGELESLAEARLRRRTRVQSLAALATLHPALRWRAAADTADRAHRLAPSRTVTACGTAGPLTLAAVGTTLCPDCYPRREGG